MISLFYAVWYAVWVSILCNMVWGTYMPCVICRGLHMYIPWVTWVMVWVYGVGTSSKGIWCGLLYAVDDRSPHHIQPVLHGIYMVWGYAVGAHEFYRCTTPFSRRTPPQLQWNWKLGWTRHWQILGPNVHPLTVQELKCRLQYQQQQDHQYRH